MKSNLGDTLHTFRPTMASMECKDGLTFDDILLIPQDSKIESRNDCNTLVELSEDLTLTTPFVSANMESVTDCDFAWHMEQHGSLGAIARKHWDDIKIQKLATPCFSISVNEELKQVYKKLAYLDRRAILIVDAAHGGMDSLRRFLDTISTFLTTHGTYLIAGNVADGWLAKKLVDCGVNAIKVGIGNGSPCSTRIVTGHGVPQLTAISDVYQSLKDTNVKIISDGGINHSGDAVKALAGGADLVMMGKVFSRCKESHGWKIVDGRWVKQYYGESSSKVSTKTPEGVIMNLNKPLNLKDVLSDYTGGLKSGMSYSGCRNLKELKEFSLCIKVSPLTLQESYPRYD